MGLESSIISTNDETSSVHGVLDAIDRLLDAIERFDAPITRELLRTAMVALVQECHLPDPALAMVN
jgi:hypothetical protein